MLILNDKKKIQKICLIQPIVKVGKALRIQKAPTGIQCISAYIKSNGFETRMFHEEPSDKLVMDIYNYSPDIIGISAFTCSFPAALSIAEELKKHLPDIPVVLGGWHASGAAESFLRGYEDFTIKEILNPLSPIDFIVVGEGEETFKNLICTLNRYSLNELEEKLSFLPGIGFLVSENKIIVNRGRRVEDLNTLPDPDWENLDIDKYRDQRNTANIDLSIHVQRGCRFHCSFCQTPTIYCNSGKIVNSEDSLLVKRFHPERVVNYLQFLIKSFNPTEITFTDEDFLSDTKWMKELCELIIKQNLNVNIAYGSFGSLNDIIKFEKHGILKLMSEAGFKNYFVGIESLNPVIINLYNRPISQEEKNCVAEYLKKIQQAINISKKRNILLFGDYIIGYFEESLQELKEGFTYLKSLVNLLYVYLPIFTPLPGTPLWEKAVRNDILLRKDDGKIDWSLYDCSHQVTKSSFNLVEVRDEFEIEFFTSENFIAHMCDHIKNEPAFLENWYIPLFNKLKKDHNYSPVFDEPILQLNSIREKSIIKY